MSIGYILYLYILALLFAYVEIESEGKHGWAEKMPTWYRVSTPGAKLYGKIMGGKPLTGYHAGMFFLPLLMLHLPFVAGLEWSFVKEVQTISIYLIWAVFWDALWFILNPHYTYKNFTAEKVWWHKNWFAGVPSDYLKGIFGAMILVLIVDIPTEEMEIVQGQVTMLVTFVTLFVITVFLAPHYHKWYWKMHEDKNDERHMAIPEYKKEGDISHQ